MPLVSLRELLADARQGGYGVLSLTGGTVELVVGEIIAAEEKRAPLVITFNERLTPDVPIEIGIPLIVNAARRAQVPIAAILDHGQSFEAIVRAIHAGSSSVMFDGSRLPYAENVARTKEVVRVAHAVGVSVEAELGSIAGSSAETGDAGPEATFTEPDAAACFVAETGVDALAISFGNVHGLYKGEPHIDLERVRKIYAAVDVPLVMHGASGLADEEYRRIVQAGIRKFNYYTAMGIAISDDLRNLLSLGEPGTVRYHEIIARSIQAIRQEVARLIDVLGCAGVV